MHHGGVSFDLGHISILEELVLAGIAVIAYDTEITSGVHQIEC